jgi:hypothetical protein
LNVNMPSATNRPHSLALRLPFSLERLLSSATYSMPSPLSFFSSMPSHLNFSVEESPPFWTSYSAIRSIKASCLEKSSLKKKRIHLPPLQRSPPKLPKGTSPTPNTFYLSICQEELSSSFSSFWRPDSTARIFYPSKLSSNSQEVYPWSSEGSDLCPMRQDVSEG